MLRRYRVADIAQRAIWTAALISTPPVRGTIGDASGRFSVDIPRLEMPVGALVYLLGPNGSGKTIYLRALVGDFPILRPEGGRVSVRGSAVYPLLIRQSADENLALGLTVFENIVVWDTPRSLRESIFPGTRRARIHAQLREFSALNLSPNKIARQLSGGQKQGLVLLTRLLRAPDLLFLDEFTSAVDAQSSQRLLDVVRSTARAHGTTSVIVTHDLDEASKNADLCIVLSCGRVFARLDVSDVPESRRYDTIKTALLEAWQAQVDR